MDRETGLNTSGDLRSKRTASAHGLNMSTEGRTKLDYNAIMKEDQSIICQELYVYEMLQACTAMFRELSNQAATLIIVCKVIIALFPSMHSFVQL